MKAEKIIKDSKLLCKIDTDEDEFDEVLISFLNTTLTDLALAVRQTIDIRVPVINGQATVDDGYRILSVDPVLNIGDRVIGKTIFTTHKGLLKIRVIEEVEEITKLSDEIDISNSIAQIIKYNMASLWYGMKRKPDLSAYWYQYYENEKSKRAYLSEAEETYQLPLPFSNMF